MLKSLLRFILVIIVFVFFDAVWVTLGYYAAIGYTHIVASLSPISGFLGVFGVAFTTVMVILIEVAVLVAVIVTTKAMFDAFD